MGFLKSSTRLIEFKGKLGDIRAMSKIFFHFSLLSVDKYRSATVSESGVLFLGHWQN